MVFMIRPLLAHAHHLMGKPPVPMPIRHDIQERSLVLVAVFGPVLAPTFLWQPQARHTAVLVAARERWELEQGRTRRPGPDFFPVYRVEWALEQVASPSDDARGQAR